MSARCYECQAHSISEERFCAACGRPLDAIDTCGFGTSPTLLDGFTPGADTSSQGSAPPPDIAGAAQSSRSCERSSPLLDTFYDEIEAALTVPPDGPGPLAADAPAEEHPQLLDAFYRELDDEISGGSARRDAVAAAGEPTSAAAGPAGGVAIETIRGVHEFEQTISLPQPWWAPAPAARSSREAADQSACGSRPAPCAPRYLTQVNSGTKAGDVPTSEPAMPALAPPAVMPPAPAAFTSTSGERPPAPWPQARASAPPAREAVSAEAARNGSRATLTPHAAASARRAARTPGRQGSRSRAWILAAGLLTAAAGGVFVTDVWSFWLPRDRFAMRFGASAPVSPGATMVPSPAGESAPPALPVRVNPPPLMTPPALPAPVRLGAGAPGSRDTTGGARAVAAGSTARARSKPPRPPAVTRRGATTSAKPAAVVAPPVEPTPVPSSNLDASMLTPPAATPAPVTGSAPPSRAPLPSVAYDVGQVDVRPQVTYRVEPSFPERAVERGSEDVVILRVLVSHTGAPADLRMLRRSKVDPAIDAAALRALRQWHFAPARKGGQAVDCWLNVGVPVRPHRGVEGSR